MSASLYGVMLRAALRPRTLASMLGAAWRFRARAWWRRAPFLPLPPPDYVRWRLHTAYGDDGRQPTPDELGRYVRWANRMHRTRLTRPSIR